MENNVNQKILQQMSILENAESERDEITDQKESNILNLIPNELHDKYNELLDNYEKDIESTEHRISEIKGEIRNLSINSKQSIRGSKYRVLFHEGKITWDTSGLLDYMVARPEIESFRRVGNPYASIYKIQYNK